MTVSSRQPTPVGDTITSMRRESPPWPRPGPPTTTAGDRAGTSRIGQGAPIPRECQLRKIFSRYAQNSQLGAFWRAVSVRWGIWLGCLVFSGLAVACAGSVWAFFGRPGGLPGAGTIGAVGWL